ncbi:hypothetical protein P8V03_18925, partial [Clostridium sp. A1-XYC3]
ATIVVAAVVAIASPATFAAAVTMGTTVITRGAQIAQRVGQRAVQVASRVSQTVSRFVLKGSKVVTKRVNKPSNATKVIRNQEIKSPNPVRAKDAARLWDEFLGEGPYTNIHPITGQSDPDRIFSSGGLRSIRFGLHEMSKMGTGKFHYHEEIWVYDIVTDTMNYYNTLRRVQK